MRKDGVWKRSNYDRSNRDGCNWKAIKKVGIDNDCEGDKGFDKLCQAIPGGGDTVNKVAATAINKGIESSLGK